MHIYMSTVTYALRRTRPCTYLHVHPCL